MGKKILIIAGDFSEDYEVMVPFQAFGISGHEVHVVSPGKKKGESIQLAVHDFKDGYQFYIELTGHRFTLNQTFDDVKIEEYDAMYLPGGRGPEYLRYDAKVVEMVSYFVKNNKPICAVCHGVLLLAATHNIKGRKMTGFYTTRLDLEAEGVEYSNKEESMVDGNLVTGQSWASHVPMLSAFLKLLN